jgi:hypothetical protein
MAKTPDVGQSSAGFLKVGPNDGATVSSGDRAALIRKGNELFNQGRYDVARKVFVTVRYSDGLIRLGNYYMKEGRPLEAFRMFWIAGDTRRVEEMTEQMAMVIRKWLQDDERTE